MLKFEGQKFEERHDLLSIPFDKSHGVETVNCHASYLSPKLEIRHRPEINGKGIFARQPIQANELLCRFGGIVVSRRKLALVPMEFRQKSLQIDNERYLMSIRLDDPPDYVNHSCLPNAGFSQATWLHAMRAIQANEEICFDYAMSDSTAYDEFTCRCGAPCCRGRITGDDWRQTELQLRYWRWFSPYLKRRIAREKAKPVK
jgi:SET domain-containing protein